MKIPWKRLSKDPIIVNIDEVYIIVTPFFGKLLLCSARFIFQLQINVMILIKITEGNRS